MERRLVEGGVCVEAWEGGQTVQEFSYFSAGSVKSGFYI